MPRSANASLPAHVIDGRAHAERLLADIRADVGDLVERHGIVPGLAVILVGDDPASNIYVRSKVRQTRRAGMRSFEHRLPAGVSSDALLDLIDRLNADPAVHGILVQLPLPSHLSSPTILAAIRPEKDVDGFHIVNAGKLAAGQTDGVIPCTPLGCLILLRAELGVLSGMKAVVVGASNIVGRPMARLLLLNRCTVTVAHLATRDLAAETRRADIVVVAAGSPDLITRDMIQPGATIIDVGISRVAAAGGTRIVGDADYEGVRAVAGRITPVPGGVGPMTIACLLYNTARTAGLAVPSWTPRMDQQSLF
ncbi:bifunctional 5,10-methylenetetrahydrofolate dehydrogenase/5,10-methenyltetrahydrofolate cyclohydrolase [Nguyenibacter vanlangensis]|uniref:bifunctional 5,10-methylenetetrahydrofolate dehydrogenase/5,10-methenyltetrahydrofolate cyclohydrolase n=1 Tax=Nguyenibacter vanlangensis TaxID=1216886 RepID=UPI001C401278|nr:bifunctional methylenetetrahydrofolate dehydrogenase/methenyltetrahydrofolate cyclohydrolase FolD [Nguyenibacter vanlangensis]